MLMMKEKIAPVNSLEEAVLVKDNALIVKLIADGAELTRPDILAAKEAFDLRYSVAVLLLESAPCLREEAAVKNLEELDAHPEMIDLVRDLVKPLPENTHPQSGELLEAFKTGEYLDAANLILNDRATLESAPVEIFDCLADFPEFLVEAVFEKALGVRLNAQLFLHLRDTAQNSSDKKKALIFEVLQLVLSLPETPERNLAVHAVWKHYTTSPFIKAIEAEPEKYSEEYLADLIMDGDLEFDVRPFKDFSPYYQVLMRHKNGVSLEQFDEEAEIEKFDAKAAFELLSGTSEYDDRINWDLVNKTARASEWLEFLAKFPQYADKADWQMINLHAREDEWLQLLKQQPAFLARYKDPVSFYTCFPDEWEEIFSQAALPDTGCFAFLWSCDGINWAYGFKVKITGDKAEFCEVSVPDDYQKFSELASKNFAAFCKALKHLTDNERFINIIR